MSASDVKNEMGETAADAQQSGPWYRYPLVWLVIAGPFIVVIAAIYSASIAYRGADLLVQDQRDATREHALRDVTEPGSAQTVFEPADKARKMGAGEHKQLP